MQAYDSVKSASSDGPEEGGYNGTNCGLRIYVSKNYTIYLFEYPVYILFSLAGFLNICLPLANSCPVFYFDNIWILSWISNNVFAIATNKWELS